MAILPSAFEPIPASPASLLEEWFDYAARHSGVTNWNSMMIATVGPGGQPSVRPVLLKDHNAIAAEFVFFTNYQSRKSNEIESNPNVAATLHWDNLERMIRIEGLAARVSAAASDAYFATRDRQSQIGAWASEQSRSLDQWPTLAERFAYVEDRFPAGSAPVPRPPHWGGFVIRAKRIEFWQGRPGRLHERLVFHRIESGADQGAAAPSESQWRSERLFP